MLSKLEQFIKDADNIPSIPSQITHLLQTINDPKVSATEIERLIVPDATLSARILRLANSAFYYRMALVTRIGDALTRLGFKTTRSLIVTVWTHSLKLFMHEKSEIKMLSIMLNHGTACAVIAKALIEKINRAMAEDAFLAALLHDMGKIAFACQYGRQYEKDVLSFAEKSTRDIASVEEQVFGFDHCVLGARLMDAWHLPGLYKETAQNHHASEIIPEKNPILAAVALADTVATTLGHNVALNAYYRKRDDLFAFFRVQDITQFKEDCESKITAMAEVLNA
jgi:putative nucleotidyltransferase with HDIG domain